MSIVKGMQSSIQRGGRKQSKNTLLLSTETKDVNIPMNVSLLEASDVKEANINVNLNIIDGLSLSNYFCYIYVNDHIQRKIRCDSLLSFKLKRPIDSLYFVFIKNPSPPIIYTYPLKTVKTKFNHLANNIKIDMNFYDSYFTYHPFDNETIVIKQKSIEIYNSYLKKWQAIPKVSNRTNIFVHFNEEEIP